ncbi:hypothetical protein J437_LFUL017298 [Ladona fulva]|uniref:RNA-directed DNA polymerase n=1 Tax=Ladona fulva TaxID=123851 RepID=A0A8K0KNZ7_LADFU|nr:hypothetical protein J437_LFUL017298 [Ladona fulva]
MKKCFKKGKLFEEQLGKIKSHKAVLHLKSYAKPQVVAAGRVPFALKKSVEHPMPTFEELKAKIARGREFMVIDLKDAYLQMEVMEQCRSVVPDKVELKPYFERREEILVKGGIILYGYQMVIPMAQLMLAALHKDHPGIVATMQSLARFYTMWPKMDQDINDWVKGCQACQENHGQESDVPLYSWNIPEWPLEQGDAGDHDFQLQWFLLSHCNTPHATTGKAPTKLFLGHHCTTCFDRLKPDPRNKVEIKVWKQKVYHDANVRACSFRQGDEASVENECKPGWCPGVVGRKTGKQ